MEAVKFRKYYGEALERRRDKARLSRRAVAEIFGVKESTVYRWEKGSNWPRDADAVSAVYVREANETSVLDLWDEALAGAREADARGELERFLTADRPSAEDLDAAEAQEIDEDLSRLGGDPESD